MKKLLRLTRLFVCLCAVLSSTTAFAGADWVGAGVINVNGTWYYADQHSSTTWASGPFEDANLGKIGSLQLGGQVQLWQTNDIQWGTSSTAKMLYKFDDAANFTVLTLNWYKYASNNNFFQSGGVPYTDNFSAETIDISGLALGNHSLTVKFVDVDNLKPTAEYTATFTKVKNINDAVVTGVDASYEWTGSVIHPVPVVVLDNNTLSSTTDYDVTYSGGCLYSGNHTVTITGKGDYAGTIVKNFTIADVYYVVSENNGWVCDPNYKLIINTGADVEEYSISNVALLADDLIKVKSPSKSEWGWWYPDGMDNDYQIETTSLYNIYFRPNYNGGDGWYHNVFIVFGQEGTSSANVALAPTGYGTYYNGVCDVTLPENTVAYILTEVNQVGDDYKAIYQQIANGSDATNNTVPAATAVLLYNSETPSSVTLTLTPSPALGTYTSNLLHGSDVATTTTGGTAYYKLTYGSESGHEDIFGWYWGADNGAAFTSPAHKVWLALPNSVAGARTFLSLPGDDITGIETIKDNKQNADNAWYDLNGRRINTPIAKGIYVKQGRKVVIK